MPCAASMCLVGGKFRYIGYFHSSQSRGIPAGSRCLGAARRPTATGRVGAEQLGFAAAPGGFSVDWCGAGRGSPSRVRNAFLFSWVLRVFLKFY